MLFGLQKRQELSNRIQNSHYYNCRQFHDFCFNLYGTEDGAVDQHALRRLWDTTCSSPDESVLSSVLIFCMRTCACRVLSVHLAVSSSAYQTIPCHHEIITVIIIIIIFNDILATVAVGPVPVSSSSHWWRTQFDSRSIQVHQVP